MSKYFVMWLTQRFWYRTSRTDGSTDGHKCCTVGHSARVRRRTLKVKRLKRKERQHIWDHIWDLSTLIAASQSVGLHDQVNLLQSALLKVVVRVDLEWRLNGVLLGYLHVMWHFGRFPHHEYLTLCRRAEFFGCKDGLRWTNSFVSQSLTVTDRSTEDGRPNCINCIVVIRQRPN